MAYYSIEPERKNLRGSFSREYEPILVIDSGDTIRYRTLDAGWGLEPPTAPGVPRSKIEPRARPEDEGHALCGPIAVRGAEPGMALEIDIDVVEPGAWGWTYTGGWWSELSKQLGASEQEQLLSWRLDRQALTGENQYGQRLRLRPFMGVLGLVPDQPGILSTMSPFPTGGNIDCKELVAGSKLFLPIAVPGALFSVGDGHAAQGDGEVCGEAIECPMDRVELTFHLVKNLRITTPRAETPAGRITFGFHQDLNQATVIAVNAMLDWMSEIYKMERDRALGLASLVVDLRITQIVNGACGVHAVLPYDPF